MTPEKMQERFIDVVFDMMDTERVSGLNWRQEDYQIRLDDIMDSLDRVEFIQELEEDFDIRIDDAEAAGWITIQDAYLCVMQKAQQNDRG